MSARFNMIGMRSSLIVLYEAQQPVTAATLLVRGLFRELFASLSAVACVTSQHIKLRRRLSKSDFRLWKYRCRLSP